MRKTSPELKNGHTYIQWIIALTANTTLFTYGLQAGWISPMTKYLQSDNSPIGIPLTDVEISWVAGILCISAVLGVPLYSYIVDRFGRKVGLIAIALPQAICWIIKLSTSSMTSLIIARVFCGLAAGGCFNVIPLYVKEISQDNIRGLLGSLLILLQNTGVLCMYAMGAYLDYNTVLWVVLPIPVVNVLMLLKTPESPSYLIKIGEVDKAMETVAFLRGLQISDKEVQNEVDTIKNEHFYYKSLPNLSICSIFTVRPWRRTFIVLLVMMTIQSCNGAFALVTYAATILSLSGVTFSPELQTLSFPALMIVSSLVSMHCIEKLGRRPVLMFTTLLSFLALSSLSSFLIIQEAGYWIPSWLTVLCLITVVTAYAGGVSPIPYVLMSEMFNFQIRAKAIGCIVTEAWFVSFIQLVVFGPLSNALGLHMTFFFFAGVNLCGFIVSLACLPETKAKTVEEIELLMSGKKT